MSKVDWINWKTEPKEIINPDKIEEHMNDTFKDYNSYMNPIIYEQLKFEMNKGGLDRNSLIIENSCPANEMTIEIVNTIDIIKKIYNNLLVDISNNVNEQKTIEKKQLIKAIEDRIKEEEELLNKIQNDNNTDNIFNISKEEYIQIIKDRIIRLKERLNQANSL